MKSTKREGVSPTIYTSSSKTNIDAEERRESMIYLYNQNILTLEQIGGKFNVSRQRVWQILKQYQYRLTVSKCPNYMVVVGSPNEDIFEEEIKRRGYEYQKQPYNAPYDFLVNGKKVELKTRSKPRGSQQSGYTYYSYDFNCIISREKVDVYVLLGLKNMLYYIIPSEEMVNFVRIPAFPKNRCKYKKYIDNWGLLE